jgi:peptide/nickel transport system permease protein
MATYIVRRLIQSAFILVGLSFIFFVILHITPGGPCAAFEGSGIAGAARERSCIQRLGLDRPLIVQYLSQMSLYLHGNLGLSNSGDSVRGCRRRSFSWEART